MVFLVDEIKFSLVTPNIRIYHPHSLDLVGCRRTSLVWEGIGFVWSVWSVMSPQEPAGIRAGRDRVVTVLLRHLEPAVARERANNIAQALVLAVEDPASVAMAMLRHTPFVDRVSSAALAAEVTRAWRGVALRHRVVQAGSRAQSAVLETDLGGS
ncbi:MAG: hypothetical protein V3V08_09090 [Nannocystaceae bacterium]